MYWEFGAFQKFSVDFTASAENLKLKSVGAKRFSLGLGWSKDTLKMNAARVESFEESVADSLLKFTAQNQKITCGKGSSSWHYCIHLKKGRKEFLTKDSLAMLDLLLYIRVPFWPTGNYRRPSEKMNINTKKLMFPRIFLLNFGQTCFDTPPPKIHNIILTAFLELTLLYLTT